MIAAMINPGGLSHGGSNPVAPTASFYMSDTQGPLGGPVYLTDTSTGNPTSWSWTVNGALFSQKQNPSYTPVVSGFYSFVLTASNAFGSNTTSAQIYTANNL